MKIIKFILISIFLLLSIITGVYYYFITQITNELNQYSGKEINIYEKNKKDYFLTFDSIENIGFPFTLSWQINGLSEETDNTKITYSNPVKLGYKLLSQKLFVNYNGEIYAKYKPIVSGFGSNIKTDDYSITIDLPLNFKIMKFFQIINNPIEVLNHIGNINISSKNVRIFDLIDNEKFYDKEFDHFELSFTHTKEYKNLDDVLNNIPEHYFVNYVAKTNPTTHSKRRVPRTLLFGVDILPSDTNVTLNAEIKTDAKNIYKIKDNIAVKAYINYDSELLEIKKIDIDYKSYNGDYEIESNAKIYLKDGMFSKLLTIAEKLLPQIAHKDIYSLAQNEIRYIVNNKDLFKLHDLENSNYDFILSLNSSLKDKKNYIKIHDFGIFSEDSGIRLQHEMGNTLLRNSQWSAKGILYIKNYNSVVNFVSAFAYRLGKLRDLPDTAKEVYTELNSEFLKTISDYPNSTSNDLSFQYEINPNIKKFGFGTVKFDQIPQLYKLILYKKLFNKVGYNSDAISKMQEIIPDIDVNDRILNQLLSNIPCDIKDNSEKSCPSN